MTFPDAGTGPNRRDLLKGAAGIAAVATASGLVAGSTVGASAPAAAPLPQQVSGPPPLRCKIASFGPDADVFELFYMTWGAATAVSQLRSGTDRVSSPPQLATVRIGKKIDGNSNALVLAALIAKPIPDVEIIQDLRDFGTQILLLKDVIVTSAGTQVNDNEGYEEFELNYTKVKFVRPGSPDVIWDLQLNKTLEFLL